MMGRREIVYSICLLVDDPFEREKLSSWIFEELAGNCILAGKDCPGQGIHIAVIEVSKWHDWVKIHRFRKRNKGCRIIPLLSPALLHTSPLAMEFKLSYLLVKSTKKHTFLRTIKKAIGELSSEGERIQAHEEDPMARIQIKQKKERHSLPFQEAFLRRLLAGEIKTEQEMIDSGFFLNNGAVPNVVCFIQGFVRYPEQREKEGWHAPMIIQESFKDRFKMHHLTFLSYRRHLLMLIHVPAKYQSLKHWKEGEEKILDGISALERDYGIQLYIGAGSIYRDPLLLHNSYREACKARRTSPYERLCLRYFEEITTDEGIQKCTDYIAQYCTEDLSVKQAADQINLSVPYFSRIFKQETGRSFVEYVTFVRMQRAVWLLRHTNHTIEWIAEELGYNTPNYFSGTFKKYVGLSPRDYRATEEILFV